MEQPEIKRNFIILAFIVLAVFSFGMRFPEFSKDLVGQHVWRQTQTYSNITHFYEEDMNILNPRISDRGNGNGIFRMEFPLMQWMVAAIYKIFGNRLIYCRLFMFLVGLLSVVGMYRLLKAVFNNNRIAIIGAWAFTFSPCFYYYTINPFSDNLALCFALHGLAFFFQAIRKKTDQQYIFCGLLLSLATLCKLPFILYYAVPFVWFLTRLIKDGFNKQRFIHITEVFILVILPVVWYAWVIPQWTGNGIVGGLTSNTVPFSTLLGYFTHHFVSTLPDLLLNYGSVLFFIAGFYFLLKYKSYTHPLFPTLAIWSLAVLMYFIFEINMIERVHDYYLFPFFPLLFMLVGYGAWNLLRVSGTYVRPALLVLLALLPLFAWLRMHAAWNTDNPGFNRDLLTYKRELREAVPKNALCIAGDNGIHYVFFYYIDKNGWGFQTSDLKSENMKTMIAGGAQFLYLDTLHASWNPEIEKFQERLISTQGSIKIFKLKPAPNE